MSTATTKSTATKTTLNIKIDKNVKEKVAQMLESMGLDHTTAIDMYYRRIIAERGLPFTPKVEPTLDEQLIAALEKSNPRRIRLEVDENGNVVIDKEKHPDLYDWAVNG